MMLMFFLDFSDFSIYMTQSNFTFLRRMY